MSWEDFRPYFVPAMIALMAYLLRDFHASFKKNIEATVGLNLSIVELKAQIQILSAQITPLSRMKEDLNALHKKVRDLEAK